MTYFLGTLTVIICFFLANTLLDNEKLERCKWLRPANPEEMIQTKRLDKAKVRLYSAIIAMGAAFTVWRLLVASHDMLNVLKLSIALICLTGSACVDYIEHRIPNLFSGSLALLAVALLMTGVLLKQDGAIAYVSSGIFAAIASTVCMVTGRFLSHQGIGIGDIKLIAALALMGGVYIIGGTLFFSMLACALISCGLLLTKNKTMKDAIPFGPFILLGYMLTICVVKF